MAYRIIYHIGEEINLKTRALAGTAEVTNESLIIKGDPGAAIAIKDIRSVSMFCLHGTGRMIKVVHCGGTLFLTVIRVNLWGYFALVNFFATGDLCRQIESLIDKEGAA